MPATTVTTTRTTGVAVHTISFRGLAGAIFTLLALALILYVIGFSSTAWTVNRGNYQGLWMTCTCHKGVPSDDWFRAVQAFITLGLIGLFLAMIIACIYMCIHSISKNTTILALIIVCFLAVVCMIVGFVIWGLKTDHYNWSFAITVCSSILCLIAGVLSIFQMRASGVRL